MQNCSNVFIVLLNWNTSVDTINCIKSILRDEPNFGAKIIIVDNGSRCAQFDLLKKWLSEQSPASETATDGQFPGLSSAESKWDFQLIRNENNSGFSAGNNIGIKIALSNKQCEYIWILNNDTEVAPNALSELLKEAQRSHDQSIIGATIIDTHTKKPQCYAGYRYNKLLTTVTPFLRSREETHRQLQQGETFFAIAYPAGASMFVPKKAFEEAGLFREELFLFYEEPDLVRRFRKHGFNTAWCEASAVFHKGGESTGGKSSVKKTRSQTANYHGNLSNLIFTLRNYPYLLPITLITRFFFKLIEMILKGELTLFPGLIKAYSDFLLHRYGDVKPDISQIQYGMFQHKAKISDD